MGIKRELTLNQLPQKYRKYNLIPTIDGVSSTVYLLGEDFILKLFEPHQNIEDEIKLLNSIRDLPIPKVIDIFKIDEFRVIIYTQIRGEILKRVDKIHILEIGKFLRDFHSQSKYIDIKTSLYDKENLKKLILKSKNRDFLNIFNKIELELKYSGAIHGDLFLDNAKFIDNRLSGVFDFSDVSLGDFYFDLAVVAVGWCFKESILDYSLVEELLRSYNSKIDLEEFLEYIRYALLYYAVLRYLNGRDYRELLVRLERL